MPVKFSYLPGLFVLAASCSAPPSREQSIAVGRGPGVSYLTTLAAMADSIWSC